MQVVTETADTTRPEAAPGALKGERDMTTITTTADIRIWLDNAGLLENMTAEETDRGVELLAGAGGRRAYGEDWGDYLGARAQALVHEVATGYDEDEPVLTAVETDGTWAVDDAAGGRWFPGDDAADEIAASNDPAGAAVRICREQPMRG